MLVEVWREVKWECPHCGNTNDIDHWYEEEVKDTMGHCDGCGRSIHITGER
jgi:predicted RNA-binding Zn-ribbon protein involved in translation (DUF1610 family)